MESFRYSQYGVSFFPEYHKFLMRIGESSIYTDTTSFKDQKEFAVTVNFDHQKKNTLIHILAIHSQDIHIGTFRSAHNAVVKRIFNSVKQKWDSKKIEKVKR